MKSIPYFVNCICARASLFCYISVLCWPTASRAFEISTTSMPLGMEMAPYSSQLYATNGSPPYIWSTMSDLVALGWNNEGQVTVPTGIVDAVSVAAGYYHSMALTSNGAVLAWGGNSSGQSTVPSGLSNIVAIAAGCYHSLALNANGSVIAWGGDSDGQSTVPTGLSNIVAIAAGCYHSLALNANGSVIAWGYNAHGQSSVPSNLSNVVAIGAGIVHSIALKSNGTVVVWGSGTMGQKDIPAGLSNVVAIASGQYFNLALKSNGTVVGWGWNDEGQTTIPAGLSNVTAIAAGCDHSLALKQDGSLVAWGQNDFGESEIPTGLNKVTSMSAGYWHTLALRKRCTQMPTGLKCTADGLVAGIPTQAGTNWITFLCQDSQGTNISKEMQIAIGSNPNVRPIIDAADPSLGLTSMDENSSRAFSIAAHDPEAHPLSYCWNFDGGPVGSNTNVYSHYAPWGGTGLHELRCDISDGLWSNAVQAVWTVDVKDIPLDISTTTLPAGMEMTPYESILNATNGVFPYTWSVMPVLVAWGRTNSEATSVPIGISNVTEVSAGLGFTIALKSDGTVTAWGATNSEQTAIPAGLSNVISISAGAYHGLALKSNGTVVKWGTTNSGLSVPVGLSNVVAISAGQSHCLAVKSDGTVVVWGADGWGNTNVPVGLSNVIAVAAGNRHSLALQSNGTVSAWGNNYYGQSTVPSGLSNVVAISAGYYQSMALKSDRTVVAWGTNRIYTGNRWVSLVPPIDLSNVVAISSGYYHDLALQSDGIVVAWGAGQYGQTQVPLGLAHVKTIDAGYYHNISLRSDRSQLPTGLTCAREGILAGIPAQSGTQEVTFVVQDAIGASNAKILNILIAQNLPPAIDSTLPTQGLLEIDEDTNRYFTIVAHDPETQPLSYAWSWNGQSTGGDSPSYNYADNWGNPGQHLLRCDVSDGVWTTNVYAQWIIAILDDDDDGVPNWKEHIAGTNPNDSNSFFCIASINGTGEVSIQSVTDRIYHLQYTTNLLEPNWLPTTDITDMGGNGGILVITSAPSFDIQRTYRIVVEHP